MPEEEVIVGADIGTLNCAMAGMNNGRVFVIDIELDKKTAPSKLLIDKADDCLVPTSNMSNPRKGDIIIEHFKPFLGRTFPADGSLKHDIKRWNTGWEVDGQGRPVYPVRGENVSPEQAYALLIKHLARMYQKQTHKTPTHVVLAVPAYWPAPRRQAALDSAKIAGFDSVTKIISEPSAAVLGYVKQHPDIKGDNIVCIDIGGGTTDVASVYVNEERTLFVVNGTAGDNELGGEHCTMALADLCRRIKRIELSEHKLRHACEMAKTSGIYPMEIQLSDETSIEVTKSAYRDACKPFLKKLGDLIDKVLKKNEDAKVIVVGGVFRDKVILEYCQDKIGIDKFIPPYSLSTAVAEGAAWFGQPNSGIVVRDSLHQSIGVETQDPSTGETDIFTEVINRGRGIPTVSSEIVLGAKGGLTEIKIYQGTYPTVDWGERRRNYLFFGKGNRW
ncbi:uncharacterized protein FFNC_15654 [Fusarium fujikuroi]|nr:uncharacterized protein FFNC_15654 [Fusarium fujikuroi]